MCLGTGDCSAGAQGCRRATEELTGSWGPDCGAQSFCVQVYILLVVRLSYRRKRWPGRGGGFQNTLTSKPKSG